MTDNLDVLTDLWLKGEKQAVAAEAAKWPRARLLLLAARFQRRLGAEAARELAELVEKQGEGPAGAG
jgi:hypothetical protein